MTIFIIALVLIFAVLCWPVRRANPDAPIVNLSALGYKLQPSKPDDEGLMLFKLIDADGQEVAATDARGTVEDALVMARKFIESEEMQ